MTEPRLLRAKDVSALTGISRASIYKFSKAGKFPPFIRVSPKILAWDIEDVNAWIRERIAQCRGAA